MMERVKPDLDCLILELLNGTDCLDLDSVVACLSKFSWAQVFQAVDRLSRHNYIELRRHGFQYDCRLVDIPQICPDADIDLAGVGHC